jgi:hypothetical protein
MNSTLTAALAALAIAAPAAAATPSVFELCDGHLAPTETSDGITGIVPVVLKPIGHEEEPKPLVFGSAGIANCDEALASPSLVRNHWRRRVNLWRARALHQLGAGAADAALADLRRAEAEVLTPDDPFYRRSLGLGITLTRAYALRVKGEKEAGEQLAMQASAQRPYSRHVTGTARRAIGGAPFRPRVLEAAKGFARLEPRAMDDIFLNAFAEGRFADVAALFSQLSPPRVRRTTYMDDRHLARLAADNAAAEEKYVAERTGQYAFALAALGRTEEARALIEAGRPRLTAAMEAARDPNGPGGGFALTAMQKASGMGLEALRDWSTMIDRLEQARAGAKVDPAMPYRGRALVEVRQAQWEKEKPAERDKLSPVERWNRGAASSSDDVQATLLDLLQDMPAPEWAEGVPAFFPADAAEFVSMYDELSAAGYQVVREQGDDVVIVRFRSRLGSRALVEEMALLRAAQAAIEANLPGMVIVDRRDYAYTTGEALYVQTVDAETDGYSTELSVIFLDPAAAPKRFSTAPWRVIDAVQVQSSLAPLLLPAKLD